MLTELHKSLLKEGAFQCMKDVKEKDSFNFKGHPEDTTLRGLLLSAEISNFIALQS